MSRTDCPSDDTLSDFVLGKLPVAELGTVAAHLDACPECEEKTGRLDGMADAVVSELRRIPGTDAAVTLESTPVDGPPGGADLPPSTERWGEFRIVREIGRGGMGVVCEAYQGSLNRHVALKFLPTHGNLARFRREAQAAGRLHHTHIVPVFGVGEHRGRHFYVMQYIVGRGLDAVLKERPTAGGGTGRPPARFGAREAARVGEQVAGALAYAHGQGVIHRDIKPSNLLLDDQGAVWVTDFGLAKVIDQQDLTGTGDFLGTLRYMPPEAFEGRYDARGDIYALGLTLYELMTLRPAFDEADRTRLVRLVAAGDPPRLRDVDRTVPRDLETVIHKAIERDPAHRYQTAAELADDLKRFIEDRPIRSRRIGEVERFARWCRRNPVPAGLLAALILVFWVGFAGVVWKWREAVAERGAREEQVVKANAAGAEARTARDRALVEEKKAVAAAGLAGRRLYSSLIDRARLEHVAANIAEADDLLDRCEPARRGWEWHFLKGVDNAEIFHLRGHGEIGWVSAAAWSPDGKWIATAGGGDPFFENAGHRVVPGTVVLWDAATGRPVHTLRSHKHIVSHVAFLEGGSLVASAGRGGEVQIHEVATGRLVRTLAVGAPISDVVAAPGGRRLATESLGIVTFWDSDTGEGSSFLPARALGDGPIAYSPDGRWFATGGGGIRLWEVATATQAPWPEHPEGYCVLAISPDSRVVAAGSVTGHLTLWNLADGRLRRTLSGHDGTVWRVAFSADGRYLASAGQDRTVRIWGIGQANSVRVIRGHTDLVTAVDFSPDGGRLVTASRDLSARVWDLSLDDETGASTFKLVPNEETVEAIAYARGGRELRSLSGSGHVYRHAAGSLGRLGDISTEIRVGRQTPRAPAAFDAEGRRLVAVDARCRLEAICVDLEEGGRRTTLRGHTLAIGFATLSADGTRAATAASAASRTSPDEVIVWDADGAVLHRRGVAGEHIERVALDPAGRRLALSAVRAVPTAGGTGWRPDRFVAVVDVDTGRERLLREVNDERGVLALGFGADGRRLAAASVDRTVLIWDLESAAAALRSRQGPEWPMDLAFSPDGRRLAIASRRMVKLMDTATAEEVLTLRGRAHLVSNTHGFNPRVRFSPDGRELFAVCDDSSDKLAVWSGLEDAPANSPARDRMARRRAVTRHHALASSYMWEAAPDRQTVLDHLEQARRIGLESPEEFLVRAARLSDHDLREQADAALERAAALSPGDDHILAAAALNCSHHGRLDRARTWFDRMAEMTGPLDFNELDDQGAGFALNADLAHYRRSCAEFVRRLESDQVGRWIAGKMAYNLSLGPDPGLDAAARLQMAQRVHDGASGADHPYDRWWATVALGAAHVRAGAPERAEPILRQAFAIRPEGLRASLAAAWMAIATWHQGRRDEARSWSVKADRFVPEGVQVGHAALDPRVPPGVSAADWWRLVLARREAQGLLLDAGFPADPFTR